MPRKGLNDVIMGRYVIDEMWERSALIYLIHDRDDPTRRFVAKCVRPEHRHTQHILDWFQREIRIWQCLSNHPYVVRLIEPNRTDATDGTNYFFIEYVEGRSLHTLLRHTPSKRVSFPQTLKWAAQIASAMEYASTQERNGHGIFVHRDLDSSNVLVTLDGKAKVSDWGLAKNLNEPEDQIAFISLCQLAGPAPGKAYWMPPEQFPPRRAQDYGVAGDIYYFGGLLTEMLVGTPVNSPEESIVLQHNAKSEKQVKEIQARYHRHYILPALEALDCPREFLDLLKGCIAPEPVNRIARFSTVLELLGQMTEEVRRRRWDNLHGRCDHCGFIALEPHGHCPVCSQPRSFKPWHPSDFDVSLDASPAPPVATPSPRQPEPPTIPMAKRASIFVAIPEIPATIGARMDVVERLAGQYGLAGARLEQFSRPFEQRVLLRAFEISSCVVSNGEYEAFVASTGWAKPPHWDDANAPRPRNFHDLPVVNVSFTDAEAFCQWKEARLPTNEEWECAARGGSNPAYPWGDDWPASDFRCHCLERHRVTNESLAPATSFGQATPYGTLYGIAGNVWEWVDGGEGEHKHTRGGSWRYQGDVYCLTWFRLPTDPDIRQDDVGFRIVNGINADELTAPPDLDISVEVEAGAYRVGVTLQQIRACASQFELSHKDVQKLAKNEARTVRMNQFRIRKHLVTNEEYWRFVSETGHPWPRDWSQKLLSWSDRPFLQRYKYHPVVRVTYRDASAFCAWAGGRLPTSDEWECAARGPDGRVYPWGDQFDPAVCNVSETGLGRTSHVAAYPGGAAPCGGLDFVGNVMEWVTPPTPNEYIVRGGSYRYKGPLYGLTYLRVPAEPDVAAGHIGFRCVLR